MGKWYEEELEEELERGRRSSGARGFGAKRSAARSYGAKKSYGAKSYGTKTYGTKGYGARGSFPASRGARPGAAHPWKNVVASPRPAATGRWSSLFGAQTATGASTGGRWSGLDGRRRHRRRPQPSRWDWLYRSMAWPVPSLWPYRSPEDLASAEPEPSEPEPSGPPPEFAPEPPPEPPPEPAAAQSPEPAPEPAAAQEPEPAPEPIGDGAAPEGAEPQGEYEYRARHGNVSVAILRWDRRTISDFSLTGIPAGGGVYVLCSSQGGVERPFYVGEADDFRLRWHKRLLEAYQLGLIGKGRLATPITAWFGVMPRVSTAVRRSVETVLLRTILLSGVVAPGGLRNGRQIQPIELTGSISIRNLLPPHWARQVAPGVARALMQARRQPRTADQQRRVVSLQVLQRGWNGQNLLLPQTIAGTVFELAAA